MLHEVSFPSGTVHYYMNSSVNELEEVCDMSRAILITDEDVAAAQPELFARHKTIIIPAGEQSKTAATVECIAEELVRMGITRQCTLIGVGGGVVTDITGFVAAVYMRGVRCGFVPTTLLAMADAAIGGKNGVNTPHYKNMLGTIRQPDFILYDHALLSTLPTEEWSNGFAEIIKYGCIFDAGLFDELAANDLQYYRNNAQVLNDVITRCVAWKNRTVISDEHEQGVRKLLNYGHTAGHAIEKVYSIAHGQAVAAGMAIACMIAEEVTGMDATITARLTDVLSRYGLQAHMHIDSAKVMETLRGDKKRDKDTIDYILLREVGEAFIHPLPLTVIEKALQNYESAYRAGKY